MYFPTDHNPNLDQAHSPAVTGDTLPMNCLFVLVCIALGLAPTESWVATNSCNSPHLLRCRVAVTSGRTGNNALRFRKHGLGETPGPTRTLLYNNELSVDSAPNMIVSSGDWFGKAGSQQRRRRLVAAAAAILLVLVSVPRWAMATAVAEPLAVSSVPTVMISAASETIKTVAPNLDALCAGPVLSMAMEVRLSLRLIFAALVGALVGWERSSSKHAAGVRTLSLVSMAAAAYTICSSFGFAGFGRVDPSRMAANVASGVGFIGAGVITTSTIQQRQEDHVGSSKLSLPSNTVHGLTTAAAIWLSAAVGVACGVGLYVVATTAALTTIAILRLGRVKPSLSTSPRLIIKPKGRKQHQQQHPSTQKETTDVETSQRDASGSDAKTSSMMTADAHTTMKSTLEYVDDEMDLMVRSAWQNASENSSLFSKEDLTNFVPSSRSTSFGSGISSSSSRSDAASP